MLYSTYTLYSICNEYCLGNCMKQTFDLILKKNELHEIIKFWFNFGQFMHSDANPAAYISQPHSTCLHSTKIKILVN